MSKPSTTRVAYHYLLDAAYDPEALLANVMRSPQRAAAAFKAAKAGKWDDLAGLIQDAQKRKGRHNMVFFGPKGETHESKEKALSAWKSGQKLAYGADRYPPRSAPRGWKPPKSDGVCPDEYAKDAEPGFRRAVTKFSSLVGGLLKQLGWLIEVNIDQLGRVLDEEGAGVIIYVKAKAGQKILLDGRSYIVLDRNVNTDLEFACLPEMEDAEVEGSEQFDVDDFAEWTDKVECPSEKIGQVSYGQKTFRPDKSGAMRLVAAFQKDWLRKSGVRSKVQKHAGTLRSPSSPKGDVPLTDRQDEAAWDAGYEAASYFGSHGKPIPDSTSVFLWVLNNDRRVPKVREGDPSFWEWVQAVAEGAQSYAKDNKLRFRMASAVDGMSKRKLVNLVNHTITKAKLNGFFRDQYWQPIQRLWKEFEKAGIPVGITKSDYEKERGVPVRKVWLFEVEFTNERGRPDKVYGRVVAAGAGSVDDPLETYDVTAYAN